MNNPKPFSLILISFFLSIIFMSSNIPSNLTTQKDLLVKQDTLKWVAPISADKISNPYQLNDENLEQGALIYKKHCRSCHGRHGDGQGVEAADLSTIVTDFTNPNLTKQSDGSIFWKINEGRNDMKSFKKKLNEEDLWLVIIYIKQFSSTEKEE